MTISAAPGTWPVEVGVVKDLPVHILLGKDWPGFDRLLAAAVQPVSPRGSRRRKRPVRGARQRLALLASDSGRDGESPQHRPNLFLDLYPQVIGGGSFAREQRVDDRLKHCWTQVRVVEGKETQPGPHPLLHFIVRNGLLYCVVQQREEEKILLVVPRTKMNTVLSWQTHTRLPATLKWPTPLNRSVAASTGYEWRPKSNVSVSPVHPARKHLRGRLPPAR